jgi:hemerythrin superfamily protein
MVVHVSPSLFKSGIATLVAGLKARQALILEYEDWLLSRMTKEDYFEDLRTMREKDEKNLRMLEEMEIQMGERQQPTLSIKEHLKLANEILTRPDFTLEERVGEFFNLKAAQVTSGEILLEALPLGDRDVSLGLSPYSSIHNTNQRHMQGMKELVLQMGKESVAGQDAEASLWAKMRQMVSGASRYFGIGDDSPLDEKSITEILELDHKKTDLLFGEILKSDTLTVALDRYESLYRELNAHAVAEEEVFYKALQDRSASHDMDSSFLEHEQVKSLLTQAYQNPGELWEFKDKIEELRRIVSEHVENEEDEVFDFAHELFSENELVVMSRRFLLNKERLLQQYRERGHLPTRVEIPVMGDSRHAATLAKQQGNMDSLRN